MIYTDGQGTIANVREDGDGRKVNPHRAYGYAIVDNADEAFYKGYKVDVFRQIHPGDDN